MAGEGAVRITGCTIATKRALAQDPHATHDPRHRRDGCPPAGVPYSSATPPPAMKLPAFATPRRDPPQRLRELKKMVLFGDLSYREARVLDGFLHERSYLPGEVIFDEGDQGEAFYLVLEGEVLICRQGEVARPIAVLPGGSFFGELALLDDAPRSAQARAATHCTLLEMPRMFLMPTVPSALR